MHEKLANSRCTILARSVQKVFEWILSGNLMQITQGIQCELAICRSGSG